MNMRDYTILHNHHSVQLNEHRSEVIRIGKSKNRQNNGQKKRYKRTSIHIKPKIE
jgi:hypothetical protein